MQEYIVQGSLGLTRGSLLRVEDGRHILVYVWEGELWITEDGDRSDRILGAGEWHRIERGGAALVYALQRSVVTLTAPEPERYARRIVLARAGSPQPVVLYSRRRERMRRFAGFAQRLRAAWSGLLAPYAPNVGVWQ
jgi:hypothetical protein